MNYNKRLVLSKNVREIFKKSIQVLCMELIDILQDSLANPQKRLWMRKRLARRDIRGASNLLLKELSVEDLAEFSTCMRMSPRSFNILLQKVFPVIQRSDSTMRMAIPAKIKLQITLSYLATGNSYLKLSQQFRVSRPAISIFIPQVCDAIYEALNEFIKIPQTQEEWKRIESDFRSKWNIPGCYGAIDGRLVNIRVPNAGSEHFNYKDKNSIILMAIVDGDYCFRYIDVGCNGKASDEGVFSQCSIYPDLENNILPDGGFIVGDDAFPLKHYLLKPFSEATLTTGQKMFNYRLSRATRIVENAFGILVSRFRVLEKSIPCKLSTVDKIIRTCCVLHNWLKITSMNSYLPAGSVDEEDIEQSTIVLGSWRSETAVLPQAVGLGSNHSSQFARNLREKYVEYFLTAGALPWQDRMVQ